MNCPNTQSTQPVESVDYSTIAELKKSEQALTKDAKELLADWELPLTFEPCPKENLRAGEKPYSTVATGIMWINGPFKDIVEAEAETLEALSDRFSDRVDQAERNYGMDR